ncbi:MAG: TerB family tellurite resistance protein [Phycisphaerae bacterium]|nr:TerB family tellurite resistance protein [Phycisphaerae bacterium]
MTEQDSRNLKNVMVVMLWDKTLTDEERAFIDTLRKRLDIEADEFQRLVAEVQADPKRLSIPKGPEGVDALGLLIEAAAADGEICDTEKKMLGKVAAFVGIEPGRLEQMFPDTPASLQQQFEITAAIEELYANFHQWDAATRTAKCCAIAAFGRPAAILLLQVMESYRTPDNETNSLELKILIAEQLGKLADTRAIYYLVQQISIGDSDDEMTSADQRAACAEAIAAIVGESFGQGSEAVQAARLWWQKTGHNQFNQLAM